jgi:hypothetical protein
MIESDRDRGDREHAEHVHWAEARSAARAAAERERLATRIRLLADLRRLAAIIEPEAIVNPGGAVRAVRGRPDHVVGGDTTVKYFDGMRFPLVSIYEIDSDGSIRGAADLDATLLHELAHWFLGYVATEQDVDALAAALAEAHEADLNAPLSAVLAHGGRG